MNLTSELAYDICVVPFTTWCALVPIGCFCLAAFVISCYFYSKLHSNNRRCNTSLTFKKSDGNQKKSSNIIRKRASESSTKLQKVNPTKPSNCQQNQQNLITRPCEFHKVQPKESTRMAEERFQQMPEDNPSTVEADRQFDSNVGQYFSPEIDRYHDEEKRTRKPLKNVLVRQENGMWFIVEDQFAVSPQLTPDSSFNSIETNRIFDADSSLEIESLLLIETLDNNVPQQHMISENSPRKTGKKLHVVREHLFIARHLSHTNKCYVCHHHFSLRPGKQAYECRLCRLQCHKNCHFQISTSCPNATDNHIELKEY